MHDPIISEEKLEAALRYLATTDESYASEKAELERAEIFRKRVRARCFLLAVGSVAQREAEAEIAQDTVVADDTYCACIKTFETLKAKRERAEIVVRVFQTLEATRRSKI